MFVLGVLCALSLKKKRVDEDKGHRDKTSKCQKSNYGPCPGDSCFCFFPLSTALAVRSLETAMLSLILPDAAKPDHLSLGVSAASSASLAPPLPLLCAFLHGLEAVMALRKASMSSSSSNHTPGEDFSVAG